MIIGHCCNCFFLHFIRPHCRIGSLESIIGPDSVIKLPHCRIGSLENTYQKTLNA